MIKCACPSFISSQLNAGAGISPLSSPVMKRLRGEDTPKTSPVMAGVPELSPSDSALFASPKLQDVLPSASRMVLFIKVKKDACSNTLFPQTSPDVIASKVHDPRMTVSQDMPQRKRRKTSSQPPIMESAMAQKTLRDGQSLCMSRHCEFCVRAKAGNITSVDVDVGSYDPQFEAEFDDIELV
jgi:hypothetical protein